MEIRDIQFSAAYISYSYKLSIIRSSSNFRLLDDLRDVSQISDPKFWLAIFQIYQIFHDLPLSDFRFNSDFKLDNQLCYVCRFLLSIFSFILYFIREFFFPSNKYYYPFIGFICSRLVSMIFRRFEVARDTDHPSSFTLNLLRKRYHRMSSIYVIIVLSFHERSTLELMNKRLFPSA